MKKLFIAIATLLATSAAHAGFMIEPYLAYTVTGEYKSGSVKEDTKGTAFGARLGYDVMGLSFGVDYMSGSGTVEASSGDTDYDLTDIGAFVAYEFPILLRVYATYILDSTAKPDGSSETSGSGMKFGLGWTGLPFVVIGVEMYSVNHDESDDGSDTDLDLTATNLVVSIPLP